MKPPRRSRYRGLGRLAGAELVNSIGTGVYYPFALLYFHHLTGLTYTVVGGVLGIGALAVLPTLGWVGRVGDRYGPRTVVVGSSLLRAAGFTLVSLSPHLATLVVCALLSALGNRSEQACGPALVASLSPPDLLRRFIGGWRASFNIGLGLGSLVGSLLVTNAAGIVAIGWVNAASFGVAAAVWSALPRAGREVPDPDGAPLVSGSPPRRSRRPLDRPFVGVVVVDALIWVIAVGVETGLSAYLLGPMGTAGWVVGTALVAATVITAVGQVPVALFLEHRALGPWLNVGTALHVTMPVVLLLGPAVPGPVLPALVIAGMAVVAVGEVLATQSIMIAMLALAPPADRGRYLTFGQQVVGLGVATTPAIVGLFLESAPSALWGLLTGLAIAALIVALCLRPALTRVPTLVRSAGSGEQEG